MKTVPLIAVLALALFPPVTFADESAQTTRVKVGQPAPDFSCRTLSGEELSLSREKGKVVVVNFFATWCGPCLEELPHLEKEVAQQFAARKDFKLIVLGREHTASELEKFQKKQKLSLPLAPDPKREIYNRYAEKFIPRNFVVGEDGKVKLASVGYAKEDFRKLVETIQQELGK
jgi:peroxiredoxin